MIREIKDATGAIVCRGGRSSGGTCTGCGRYAGATFLCDFPVLRDGRETMCDRRVCSTCKTVIGPDRDLCTAHKPLWDFERGVPTVGPQAAPPLTPYVDPVIPEAIVRKTQTDEAARETSDTPAEPTAIRKGDRIRVVAGRKVPTGVTGIVFWIGESEWGTRIGFKSDAGVTHWTAAKNVERFTTRLLTEAEAEAIAPPLDDLADVFEEEPA